ncbi:DUF1828 domain-containing protein [Thermodesulfovibrio yellowstonii]|uniref:DUF1828 domain-containing protein n=2 Tax=Thermodesulfovibrio yellowstonii TaxID=28262 RepID=B5YI33_THEYD|nr:MULTISPECIES: DUF1828 domain-containing protein [Thermodesulfovibrio]ACI21842.1 hypothetical protein THEYE_A0250 [Thermodesulfovibrio yellowstonii DSM 11347]MDI6864678.1 DUF1828 domain-containing protein [Thermodesulfovibrio yellowstonii]GLI54436.1 DUF1828 domain-containing protein [Thermodesulfovibrio islandicus]
MNLITKIVILPKVGKTRITFYRDKRKVTKDKTTFSLPFDMQLNEKIASGEIIYSPMFRSCRIMWNEAPEDIQVKEEAENFIKEFLFGTLLTTTEPIEPQEAEEIFDGFIKFLSSSIQYRITGEGACVLNIPIAAKQSKMLKIILRKKDTGDYFLSDDGFILRSFRPHERGQRERVVFATKKLGIEIKEDELFLDSSPEELSENLYKFIQFVSAVYLFYLT